jgi:hypothetical protein
VLHEGAGDPPNCPGEFPSLVHDELHAGLQPGVATCDCECGDVVGASCGAATLAEANNMCNGPAIGGQEWLLNPLTCHPVSLDEDEYLVDPPALTTAGASCSPQATEVIPTPTWSASVRSCAVPDGEACDGGTCGATPPADF